MNIQEKRKRLQELLEKNIRYEEIGTAIAITGSWGVGKTYFWNEFLKEVTKKEIYDKNNFYYEASRVGYKSIFDNRKYAYISLFGIEHLSDLKNAICTKLSLNPYAKSETSRLEFSQLLKNTVAQFKDVKVSQYGVSASAKILEALLFLQVKDAIICFDDFERMSNKLDIKDIMGLANQLKLEKNCQVILILDELKTEGENKSKYAEYKEKLIDEEIKITSVEPLIRENATEFDQQLIELMVEFADELEIHNFRFFQKVIKLYNKFRSELPEEVAYSTKEIILIRILQGYLIKDYPLLEHDWYDLENDDMIITRSDSNQLISEIKKGTLKKLNKISNIFLNLDQWATEYRKWFDQEDNHDIELLKKLVTFELISEEQNIYKVKLANIIKKLKNLQADSNSCKELYNCVVVRIHNENLSMLWQYYLILEKFGEHELSNKLKKEIKAVIDNSLSRYWEEISFWGENNKNIFHRYLKMLNFKKPIMNLPSLEDVLECYIIDGSRKNGMDLVIKNSTLDDWHFFIWDTVPNNSKLCGLSLFSIITSILEVEESNTEIRGYIDQILREKSNESKLMQNNVDFLCGLLKK